MSHSTANGTPAERAAMPKRKPVPMPVQQISYWTPGAILSAIARMIARLFGL